MLDFIFRNMSQGEELFNKARAGSETRLVGVGSFVAESPKQDRWKDLSRNSDYWDSSVIYTFSAVAFLEHWHYKWILPLLEKLFMGPHWSKDRLEFFSENRRSFLELRLWWSQCLTPCDSSASRLPLWSLVLRGSILTLLYGACWAGVRLDWLKCSGAIIGRRLSWRDVATGVQQLLEVVLPSCNYAIFPWQKRSIFASHFSWNLFTSPSCFF